MPVTAYQVSERGERFLEIVPANLRDEVDSVCYPKVHNGEACYNWCSKVYSMSYPIKSEEI